MSQSRSEAYRAVGVALGCGLRARELTQLKVEDVHLDGKGAFGCGWVEVLSGKGGKRRIAPIVNTEGVGAVSRAIEGKASESYVAARQDGCMMSPGNLQKALRTTMEKLYGKGFMCGNRIHAYRKLYAATAFSQLRKQGKTKQQAVRAVCDFLGHGERTDIAKVYISNLED